MSSLSTISLFTGAGGLDIGFEAAGYETSVAIECDASAVETLTTNRDWEVIHGDICSGEGSSKTILNRAGLKVGDAQILLGGPPCQPFSKSGFWFNGESKRLNDPRAITLKEYLRVLEDTLPNAFLLENVPGLTFSNKSEGLIYLQNKLALINSKHGTNYSFNAKKLNCAEFGVPQIRSRVFVIGHRDGLSFSFPKPTHQLPSITNRAECESTSQEFRFLPKALTAWEAIGHLRPLSSKDDLKVSGKWADLLPSIPEGCNYLYHTNRGGGLQLFGWRSRFWSMLLKLSKHQPSWTITANPGPATGPFHWENRRLAWNELCAIQTFPPDYEIIGKRNKLVRQIGNAVPPLMAEILGIEIRRQWFGLKDKRKPRLSVKSINNIPPPDPVYPVTEPKYLSLVANYSDHPGIGLGPGAQRRNLRQRKLIGN